MVKSSIHSNLSLKNTTVPAALPSINWKLVALLLVAMSERKGEGKEVEKESFKAAVAAVAAAAAAEDEATSEAETEGFHFPVTQAHYFPGLKFNPI